MYNDDVIIYKINLFVNDIT